MKKIWIILKVAGIIVCLFFIISGLKEITSVDTEISKAKAEADKAWKNLEHAAPTLVEQYNHAIERVVEKQQEHQEDILVILLAFPLSILIASLIVPIFQRKRPPPQ